MTIITNSDFVNFLNTLNYHESEEIFNLITEIIE